MKWLKNFIEKYFFTKVVFDSTNCLFGYKEMYYQNIGFANINDFTEFNKILTVLNKTQFLNNGGCGLSAYIISKELDKYNINYEYVIEYIYDKDIYSISDLPYTHIYLKIGNYKVDSNNVYLINETRDIILPKSYISILKAQCVNRKTWNKMFNPNSLSMFSYLEVVNDAIECYNTYDEALTWEDYDLTPNELNFIENTINKYLTYENNL